ncbi:MAG: pyrroline-5-carboxylate reductase [Dehalococcoidia bacterium]
MRVALIGGGFMGEAVVSGLLKEGLAQPGDVTVADVAPARRDYMSSEYGVSTTADNEEAVREAEIVLLAVKPQEFEKVAAGLAGHIGGGQTVVSIMAGVRAERIVSALGHDAVVRVMPNTAALVGQAMSVWLANDAVTSEGIEAVERLLRALGREVRVYDEAQIEMATALSGSGPGFIFLMIEALIDGGVQIGLAREQSKAWVLQTVFGAACLARETGKDAAELRQMVTSKGGTTAAGLQALEDGRARETIVAAVEAAYERAKELGA